MILSGVVSKVMTCALAALLCYSLGISYLYTQELEKRVVAEREVEDSKSALERANGRIEESIKQCKMDLQIKENLCKSHEERREASDKDKSEIEDMMLKERLQIKEVTNVPEIQGSGVVPVSGGLPDSLARLLDNAYERNSN